MCALVVGRLMGGHISVYDRLTLRYVILDGWYSLGRLLWVELPLNGRPVHAIDRTGWHEAGARTPWVVSPHVYPRELCTTYYMSMYTARIPLYQSTRSPYLHCACSIHRHIRVHLKSLCMYGVHARHAGMLSIVTPYVCMSTKYSKVAMFVKRSLVFLYSAASSE